MILFEFLTFVVGDPDPSALHNVNPDVCGQIKWEPTSREVVDDNVRCRPKKFPKQFVIPPAPLLGHSVLRVFQQWLVRVSSTSCAKDNISSLPPPVL